MKYGYVNRELYLAHHGIKGQKWGTRNGPPYPLDDSDHSAREKKLNKGHYSQGVHQDREETSEEHQQKVENAKETAKKIAKGVAIGTGIAAGVTAVTAATATTAALAVGGTAAIKYGSKHPREINQALSNIGSSLIETGKNIHAQHKINKMSGEDKTTAQNILDATKKANRYDRANKLNAARYHDTRDQHTKALKGIMKDRREVNELKKVVDSKSFIDEIGKTPSKLTDNVITAAQEKGGQKLVNELTGTVLTNNKARNVAAQEKQNYKNTHGVRGVYNKVGKAYDTTTGFLNNNINRINRGRNIVLATGGMVAGAKLAAEKKKKKQQQEYQQYYY